MAGEEDDPLAHVPAWLAGALGGAVASLAQFIGGPANDCLAHFFWGDWRDAMRLFAVFLFATSLLMLAGALVGFFVQSRTRSRWTIFLSGATATAIVTMALPGIKPLINKIAEVTVSSAYASDDLTVCSDTSARASSVSFGQGLKAFFGLDEPRYRVVVGSFKNQGEGTSLANRIKSADPTLKAYVGERAPCNEYYPVIVSDYVSAPEAKRIQEKVLKLGFVAGAFLSPQASSTSIHY
jgi:hypothetical protein